MRIEFSPSAPFATNLVRFAVRTGATAVGLWVAAAVVPGISVTGASGWATALTLLGVAVIFGVVDSVLKPVVKILGFPFYLVTLWLISFVVNALLFLLVGWLAGVVHLAFAVDGFWSAFWGAILVSLVTWAITRLVPEAGSRRRVTVYHHARWS